MLKGYIERELPQWTVTIVDLNIWLCRFLFNGLQNGDIHLTPRMHQEMGGDTARLLEAAAVFNGKDDEAFYNNSAR